MTEVLATPAEFDQIVLVHPPWNAALAEKIKDDLHGWTPAHVALLPTVEGGYEPNAERIQREARAGSVLTIVGGDGTGRLTLGALSLPEMDELRKEVCVTSANQGGNGVDYGRSLHGRWNRQPRSIFCRGLQAVTAYLLDCSVENEFGIQHHMAVSYLALGKSANQTDRLNSDAYKNGRKYIRDAKVLADACLSDSSFGAITRTGHLFTWGDVTYAKAPCMAKLAQHPVEIWNPELRVTTVGPSVVSGIQAAAGLLIGKAPGFTTSRPSRFATTTPVRIHCDGDPSIEIPPQSLVTIEIAPQTYTALTTRRVTRK